MFKLNLMLHHNFFWLIVWAVARQSQQYTTVVNCMISPLTFIELAAANC